MPFQLLQKTLLLLMIMVVVHVDHTEATQRQQQISGACVSFFVGCNSCMQSDIGTYMRSFCANVGHSVCLIDDMVKYQEFWDYNIATVNQYLQMPSTEDIWYALTPGGIEDEVEIESSKNQVEYPIEQDEEESTNIDEEEDDEDFDDDEEIEKVHQKQQEEKEDSEDQFSIVLMLDSMKHVLKTAKQDKLKIMDYVDMYTEGGKFYKYFGRALNYCQQDMFEKARTIRDNVQIITEAYGISKEDPRAIYMKEFTEFEMEKNLIHFNLDENQSMLKKWAEADIKPFMKTYVSTTFYFERGAWMFDFLHELFGLFATEMDRTNYDIGKEAYEKTLATHHNWILRQAVKFALYGMNDRKDVEKYYLKEQRKAGGNTKPQNLSQMYSDISEFSKLSGQMGKQIWSFLRFYGIEHLP